MLLGRACRESVVVVAALLVAACGYHHYAGPLRPAPEQAAPLQATADGGVEYQTDGLRMLLVPQTDEQLNRQFASSSQAGVRSTNPFTFGNTAFWDVDRTRQRFAVFRLLLENRAHPKVQVDPARMVVRAAGGREYWSLGLGQLDAYYRAYAVGYQGNEYARYQERRDLLKRSLFSNEEVFSGQTADGFVVFPALEADVRDLTVVVHDVGLRFDFRNEAVETADLAFRFTRDTGRMYRDGRVVIHGDRHILQLASDPDQEGGIA